MSFKRKCAVYRNLFVFHLVIINAFKYKPFFSSIICMNRFISWKYAELSNTIRKVSFKPRIYSRLNSEHLNKHSERKATGIILEIGNELTYCEEIEDYVHNKLLESNVIIDIRSVLFLLCVSGGSDSIAMLHIFNNIRKRLESNLNIEVINFNHKMRFESDEEVYDNFTID